MSQYNTRQQCIQKVQNKNSKNYLIYQRSQFPSAEDLPSQASTVEISQSTLPLPLSTPVLPENNVIIVG